MKDSVFTAKSSFDGRRKELWETPSGGSCMVPAAVQAEKHRRSGDARLSFIAETCDSETAGAFQRHTAVS